MSNALFARYKSTDETKFSEKVVAAMRKEFGGHAIHQK
jgi:6-phosphogluconate dehydrogenase